MGHASSLPAPSPLPAFPSLSALTLPAGSEFFSQLQLLHYAIKVQNVQHARPLKAFDSHFFFILSNTCGSLSVLTFDCKHSMGSAG